MKKLNKKGFTLAELLVVVAIIAVLTAIAIPVFGAATAKAEFAKDLANVRAAYAEAVIIAMTDDDYDGGDLDVAKTSIDSAKGTCALTYTDGVSIVVTSSDSAYTGTIPVDPDVDFV